MPALPLVCDCKNRLWKVSLDRERKIVHFTCSRCGRYHKLEPPSAREILQRNPQVVEEFVKKELERLLK